MAKLDYSREELLDICEKALVSEAHWGSEDSAWRQLRVGQIWALLKDGCAFKIILQADCAEAEAEDESAYCPYYTNERTIWFEIYYRGKNEDEVEIYFLPTIERLTNPENQKWD